MTTRILDASVAAAWYLPESFAHNVPIVTGERSTTPWVAKLGPLAEPL